MTLIKSISGIRGTIGGKPNQNLTPIDIVKFVSAYSTFIKTCSHHNNNIVVGRDARISGQMIESIVNATLIANGMNVINIGLNSTPTTEFAVIDQKAAGGIIITASHNPKNWNALKLLNNKGEFLNDLEGKKIIDIADKRIFNFEDINNIGSYQFIDDYDEKHINSILNLKLVNVQAIKKANFKVAIDGINSVGGIVVPKLLKKLGVKDIIEIHCEPNGDFKHNPEPLPENLTDISNIIKENNIDVGFAVDPDVDRLAIICEDGNMFGEEYTLVSIANFVLSKTPGNTVSNLSSTQALKDITEKYNMQYQAAAVGEVNVVAKMKEINAIIGGEGNGGIIYPAAHYGRDALVGIALFLSLMAETKLKTSQIKQSLPQYYISKNKIQLDKNNNIDEIFKSIANKYKDNPIHTIDGLKIEFPKTKEWVHLRKSNTEPIIRIYAESKTMNKAEELSKSFISSILQNKKSN